MRPRLWMTFSKLSDTLTVSVDGLETADGKSISINPMTFTFIGVADMAKAYRQVTESLTAQFDLDLDTWTAELNGLVLDGQAVASMAPHVDGTALSISDW